MFYMHHSRGGWGWGSWVLMTISMIALSAHIIYGIVWLSRGRPADDREQGLLSKPPEDMLK